MEPWENSFMSRLICGLLLGLCMVGTPSWAKRPITHEDVWLMKRVGAPVASPDGKWAVFSVREPSYDPKQEVSDLWIVPVDGSQPARRLTSTKGGEGDVVWSPDSTRIAFSAKREGDDDPQVYILPVTGGEAERFTALSTGATRPRWRPDGQALLFESKVYPGALDDAANKKIAEARKERKYNARVYERVPFRHWDRWLDDRQTHIFVQELRSGSQPRDLLAPTKFVAQPGFGKVSMDESLDPIWAPDGDSIVFDCSTDLDRAINHFTTTHLFRLPVKGGEPVPLSSGDASYSGPAFSPDGKTLYMTYEPADRGGMKLYSLTRLAMLPWPVPADARPRILTSNWDRAVGDFQIAPDSKSIYIIAEEYGHDKLFVMPAAGGNVKLSHEVEAGGYSGLSIPAKADSTVILANWFSTTNPPEVVRIAASDGKRTALTHFCDERIAEIDWQPAHHFWFTSKAGARIHNMIVLPPAFDENKKYPLMVFMHGGPHNGWKDQFFLRWNFQYLASPGYVVLMTNYTGSSGFGEEFADGINRDPLRTPANEINEAADEAIRRFPFIDAKRQIAGGASYGGYLANWMEATTSRYLALFNHAGLTNNESMWGTTDGAYYWERKNGSPVWEGGGFWQSQNPLRYAAQFKTPMLVTHGEGDYRVPVTQGFEIFKLLQRRGVQSKLILFPEENHWILKGENNRYFFRELFAWLEKYTGIGLKEAEK